MNVTLWTARIVLVPGILLPLAVVGRFRPRPLQQRRI
ncbi:MAG: hypothetical protein QOD27_732 [Microbacteriaceae bacterium]|jgi:hypothetical protein|nr:hypothetical protein [Microbacteriaceae bacterium]MDQ1553645.1 hypothetical protein [Microbacteriaceae bacterium]